MFPNNTTGLLKLNDSFGNDSSSTKYYDPNKDECTLLAQLVIYTVLAGSVCVLGLAGNAFSFVVLRRDHQTPVASFLLRALALMDSLFLGLWFVLFSVSSIFDYARLDQHSYKYWMFLRLYSYQFMFIGQTATIWCTVLIALTRFIAICIPYRATQLCNLQLVKKAVLCLCILSVVYNLPRFFDTSIFHVVDKDKYHFYRTSLGKSNLYQLLYLDIAYYIFSFVLPLLILAVLNTKLTIAYRHVQKRRRHLRGRTENNPGHKSSQHSDPNITLVMIIVVLVFMLCNLPARVVQIVLRYRDQECMTPEFVIKEVSNVLEVLNSSVNFIIYCVFRKQFRETLWRVLRCKPAVQTTCEATTNTVVNGYTMVNKDVQDKEDKQQNGDKDKEVVTNGNKTDTEL